MSRDPRRCANPECLVDFVPKRITQRFHDPDCRRSFWAKAYHWTPHPCPLCTAVHDPEEPAILDALEMELRDLQLERLHNFIARRRAILAPD